MNQVTLQAFLDELSKIAGEGYDKLMQKALSRVVPSAERAVETGVGHAHLPFIPTRGAKVLGQDVKQMMQSNQVKGALKLRNPAAAAHMQNARAAYGDIDRYLQSEAGTVLPGGSRTLVQDVGRGVRTPQELSQQAASVRNKILKPYEGELPSPHAPVSGLRSSTGSGMRVGGETNPAMVQNTDKFIPGRSGTFPRGTATAGLPPAPVSAAPSFNPGAPGRTVRMPVAS